MKKHFTTKEEFEAYISRTGQNDDYKPSVYRGYQTIDFCSEREITEAEYMTEKAYMLQMYDDYVDKMQLDPRFDKTFEDFLHYDCEINDYYHGILKDIHKQGNYLCVHCFHHRTGCRGSYPYCDPRLYSLDEVIELVLTEGILITSKNYKEAKQ